MAKKAKSGKKGIKRSKLLQICLGIIEMTFLGLYHYKYSSYLLKNTILNKGNCELRQKSRI